MSQRNGPACPLIIGMQVITSVNSFSNSVLLGGTGKSDGHCGGGRQRHYPGRAKYTRDHECRDYRDKGNSGAWRAETQSTIEMVVVGRDTADM